MGTSQPVKLDFSPEMLDPSPESVNFSPEMLDLSPESVDLLLDWLNPRRGGWIFAGEVKSWLGRLISCLRNTISCRRTFLGAFLSA